MVWLRYASGWWRWVDASWPEDAGDRDPQGGVVGGGQRRRLALPPQRRSKKRGLCSCGSQRWIRAPGVLQRWLRGAERAVQQRCIGSTGDRHIRLGGVSRKPRARQNRERGYRDVAPTFRADARSAPPSRRPRWIREGGPRWRRATRAKKGPRDQRRLALRDQSQDRGRGGRSHRPSSRRFSRSKAVAPQAPVSQRRPGATGAQRRGVSCAK